MTFEFIFYEMKRLYSNSNEICELIESECGWTVTPLESLEDPGELLLFDLYDSVYYHPSERTESVLLQERPEWKSQVLPLVKARGYALLLSKEWHIMKYENNVFRFEPLMDEPKKLQDRHCLLSTDSLPFMFKQAILELIRPASYANQLITQSHTQLICVRSWSNQLQDGLKCATVWKSWCCP